MSQTWTGRLAFDRQSVLSRELQSCGRICRKCHAKRNLRVFGYWSRRRSVVLVAEAIGMPVNCEVHVAAIAIKAKATGSNGVWRLRLSGFATEKETNRRHGLV